MPDADEITTPAVSLPVSPEQLELQTLLGEMRNDFLFYIKACDPAYIVSKVHVYLTQRLQEVADGRCKRLSTPHWESACRRYSDCHSVWVDNHG